MKTTAGDGRVSGFAWGGDKVTHWITIGKERYPLTDQQWERRKARLAAKGSER